jgi:hypothetical protein
MEVPEEEDGEDIWDTNDEMNFAQLSKNLPWKVFQKLKEFGSVSLHFFRLLNGLNDLLGCLV